MIRVHQGKPGYEHERGTYRLERDAIANLAVTSVPRILVVRKWEPDGVRTDDRARASILFAPA